MVTITFLGKNEEIIRVETIEKGSLVEQKDPEETLGFSGWFTEEEIPRIGTDWRRGSVGRSVL